MSIGSPEPTICAIEQRLNLVFPEVLRALFQLHGNDLSGPLAGTGCFPGNLEENTTRLREIVDGRPELQPESSPPIVCLSFVPNLQVVWLAAKGPEEDPVLFSIDGVSASNSQFREHGAGRLSAWLRELVMRGGGRWFPALMGHFGANGSGAWAKRRARELDEAESFLKRFGANLPATGFTSRRTSERSCLGLDLSSPTAEGHYLVWTNGHCEAAVAHLDGGETVIQGEPGQGGEVLRMFLAMAGPAFGADMFPMQHEDGAGDFG